MSQLRPCEVPAGLSVEREVLHEGQTMPLVAVGETTTLQEELAGCVRSTIERLSQDDRGTITLIEIEGVTHEVAVTQMRISCSGMKSCVQQGRKQLKQMLDGCCLIDLDRRGGVVDCAMRDGGCDSCNPSFLKDDE